MNRNHATVIYAMGCARGAAMAALKPADLDTLTDDQITARLLPVMGRVPMATEDQLAEWVADDEGGMVLDGLEGFRWWRKRRRSPVAAAVVTPAPAQNWATLHGLDDLGGGKWKKRLKRLGKNLKKVAGFAIAPTMGGIKGIKKQIEFAKNNKGLLVGAAGLLTGNPALITAGQLLKKQDSAPSQGQAMPEAVDVAQPYQVAMPAYRSQYAPAEQYPTAQADTGQVKRLQDEEKPQVVGINWNGIVESMKANPVPWAVGTGGVLYLLTRRNNHAS